MKQLILLLSLTVVFVSCGNSEGLQLTKDNRLIMDSIANEYNCSISVIPVERWIAFSKPSDMEIVLTGSNIQKDSMPIVAQSIADRFSPTIINRKDVRSIIVRFLSQEIGNAGTGTDTSYEFKVK